MIRGTVVATGGALPVSGANISLVEDMGMSVPRRYVSRTDSNGRFEFANAPITRYKWSVSAPGYKDSEGPLAVTSSTTSFAVELDKLASISGRVLTPNGRPVPAVQVSAFLPWGEEGTPVSTDSNGRFTIGVSPGRYLVVAHPGTRAVATTAEVKGAKTGWLNTFYPSSATRDGAQAAIVRSGEPVANLDIRVHEDSLAPLSGSVVNATGTAVRGATVSVFSSDAGLRFSIRVISGVDGKFSFPAIPAGNWTVLAENTEGNLRWMGSSPFVAGGSAVDNFQVRVTLPFTVSGRIAYAANSRGGVLLMLRSAGQRSTANAVVREDGSFAVSGLFPGRYRIIPSGKTLGQYVESIRFGDTEVLGREVAITGNDPPITIQYMTNGGLVKGIVREGKRGSVVLVPIEEARRNMVFILTVASDPEGRFEFPSVRPGEYYAFAFPSVDEEAFFDPVFFNQLMPTATSIRVAAGESMIVEPIYSRWPW